jgi:hypothetical protein
VKPAVRMTGHDRVFVVRVEVGANRLGRIGVRSIPEVRPVIASRHLASWVEVLLRRVEPRISTDGSLRLACAVSVASTFGPTGRCAGEFADRTGVGRQETPMSGRQGQNGTRIAWRN